MVEKKASSEGLQTYISPVIEDGISFEEAIALLLSFYPENYGWIKVTTPVDLKADYVISYTGNTPDDVTKFGNFVADHWTNGPADYTATPISFSIVGTVQNDTPVAYMYVKDGPLVYGRTCDSATSEWKRIDIEDSSTGLPGFFFHRGETTPPNNNALWIKPSYAADGAISSIDALCHLSNGTDWTSLHYPGKMDVNVYDSKGKHSSPFEYVARRLNTITSGYGDFLLHKQNLLVLVHVTAGERGVWDSALSVLDLTKLVETAKTDMTTKIASEYEKHTRVEETDTKLTTSHDEQVSHIADTTAHITTTEKTGWDAKAAGDHVHTASTGGNVTISGEKVVSGIIPMSKLPDEIKERLYEIISLDILAKPITEEQRHSTYHNGNILTVPPVDSTDITHWYRITDQNTIGTPQYMNGLLEFTNTGSLFDKWEHVRNAPTTLEGYGISSSSREDSPQTVEVADFPNDPNIRVVIRQVFYDSRTDQLLLLADNEDIATFTHEIALYQSPTGEVWTRLPIRFSTIGLTRNAYTRVHTISVTKHSNYLLAGQQLVAGGMGPLIVTSPDLINWTVDTKITNEVIGATNATIVASYDTILVVTSDTFLGTINFNDLGGTSTHTVFLPFDAHTRCNDVTKFFDYTMPIFAAQTIYEAAFRRDSLCYLEKTWQLNNIDFIKKLNIVFGTGGELIIDSVFSGVDSIVIAFRLKLEATKPFVKKILTTKNLNLTPNTVITIDDSLTPFAYVDNYVYCKKSTPTGLQIIKKPMDVLGAGAWEVDVDLDGISVDDLFYEKKNQIALYVRNRHKIEATVIRRNPNALVRLDPSFSDLTSNSSVKDFSSLIYDEENHRYICVANVDDNFRIYASDTGEHWTVLSTNVGVYDYPFPLRRMATIGKVQGRQTWIMAVKDTTVVPTTTPETDYDNVSGIYTSSDLVYWETVMPLPDPSAELKIISATESIQFYVYYDASTKTVSVYRQKNDNSAIQKVLHGTTTDFGWTTTVGGEDMDSFSFSQRGNTCALMVGSAFSYPGLIHSSNSGASWVVSTKGQFPILSKPVETTKQTGFQVVLSENGFDCYILVGYSTTKLGEYDGWFIGKANTSDWNFVTKHHTLADLAMTGEIDRVMYLEFEEETQILHYALSTVDDYMMGICMITENSSGVVSIQKKKYSSNNKADSFCFLSLASRGVGGELFLLGGLDPTEHLVDGTFSYPLAYSSYPVDLQLSERIYTKTEIDAFFSAITSYQEASLPYANLTNFDWLSLGDVDYVGIQERIPAGTGAFPMDEDAFTTIHTQKKTTTGEILTTTKIAPKKEYTGSFVQKYDISSIENAVLTDVVYTGLEYIAVGTKQAAESSIKELWITKSPDGEKWTDVPANQILGSTEVHTISGILISNFGIHIYGTKSATELLVFFSEDAVSWKNCEIGQKMLGELTQITLSEAIKDPRYNKFYLYGTLTTKTEPSMKVFTMVFDIDGSYTYTIGALNPVLATTGNIQIHLSGSTITKESNGVYLSGSWSLDTDTTTKPLLLYGATYAPSTWVVVANKKPAAGPAPVTAITAIRSITSYYTEGYPQERLVMLLDGTFGGQRSSAVGFLLRPVITPGGFNMSVNTKIYDALSSLPGTPSLDRVSVLGDKFVVACRVTTDRDARFTLCYSKVTEPAVSSDVWYGINYTWQTSSVYEYKFQSTTGTIPIYNTQSLVSANGNWFTLADVIQTGSPGTSDTFALVSQIEPYPIATWKKSTKFSIVCTEDVALRDLKLTFTRVRYLNGFYWAVGYGSKITDTTPINSAVIARSDDGTTWGIFLYPFEDNSHTTKLYDITYSKPNTLYIAVGEDKYTSSDGTHPCLLKSKDGVTWLRDVPSIMASLRGIVTVPESTVPCCVGFKYAAGSNAHVPAVYSLVINADGISINLGIESGIQAPFGELLSMAKYGTGSMDYTVGFKRLTETGRKLPMLLTMKGFAEQATDAITAYIGTNTANDYELVDIAVSDTKVFAIGNGSNGPFYVSYDGASWKCREFPGGHPDLKLKRITYTNEFLIGGVLFNTSDVILFRATDTETIQVDPSFPAGKSTASSTLDGLASDGITSVVLTKAGTTFYHSTEIPVPTFKTDIVASQDLQEFYDQVPRARMFLLTYLKGIYMLVDSVDCNYGGSYQDPRILCSVDGTHWKNLNLDVASLLDVPKDQITQINILNCCTADERYFFLVGNYQIRRSSSAEDPMASYQKPFAIFAYTFDIYMNWKSVPFPMHAGTNVPDLASITSICGRDQMYIMSGENRGGLNNPNLIVYTSPNCYDWKAQTISNVPNNDVVEMVYARDSKKFVGVCTVESTIITSDNGTVWTKTSIAFNPTHVRYLNGTWFICGSHTVGTNTTGALLRSTDAANWTVLSNAEFDKFDQVSNITYLDGIYFAIAQSTYPSYRDSLLYSSDLFDWKLCGLYTNDRYDKGEYSTIWDLLSSPNGLMALGDDSDMYRSGGDPCIWRYGTSHLVMAGYQTKTITQTTTSNFFDKFPVKDADIFDKTKNPNYASSGCGIGYAVTRHPNASLYLEMGTGDDLSATLLQKDGLLYFGTYKYQMLQSLQALTSEDMDLVKPSLENANAMVAQNAWHCIISVRGESEETVKFRPLKLDGTIDPVKELSITIPKAPDLTSIPMISISLDGARCWTVDWTPKGMMTPRSTSTVDLLDYIGDTSPELDDPLLPLELHYPLSDEGGDLLVDSNTPTKIGVAGSASYTTSYLRCRNDVIVTDLGTLESTLVPGGDPKYYFQNTFHLNMESVDREWTNVNSMVYPEKSYQPRLDALYGLVESQNQQITAFGITGRLDEYPAVSKTVNTYIINYKSSTNWTSQYFGTCYELVDGAYDGDQTTVVIGNGKDDCPHIYYMNSETDSSYYEVQNLTTMLGYTTAIFNRVTYSEYRKCFLIVGQKNGTDMLIVSSTDGKTWKEEKFLEGSRNDYRGMLLDVSDRVAVGQGLDGQDIPEGVVLWYGGHPLTPTDPEWIQLDSTLGATEVSFNAVCLNPQIGSGLIFGKDEHSTYPVAYRLYDYVPHTDIEEGAPTIEQISLSFDLSDSTTCPFPAGSEIRQVKWDEEHKEFIVIGHPNVIVTMYAGTKEANAISAKLYDWHRSPEVTKMLLNESKSPGNSPSLVGASLIRGKWYAYGRTTAIGNQYPILQRNDKHTLMMNPVIEKDLVSDMCNIVYGNGMYLCPIFITADQKTIEGIVYQRAMISFLSSIDGIRWKRLPSTGIGEDIDIYMERTLIFLNDTFIVYGRGVAVPGTSRTLVPYLHYSKDGITWQRSTFTPTEKATRIKAIATNGTTTILISNTDTAAYRMSASGPSNNPLAAWTIDQTDNGRKYNDVVYFEKKRCFVIVGEDKSGNNNDIIYTKTDGSSWYQGAYVEMATKARVFDHIACGPDWMVLTGRYGTSGTAANQMGVWIGNDPQHWVNNQHQNLEDLIGSLENTPYSLRYMDGAFYLEVDGKYRADADGRISQYFLLRSDTGWIWRRVQNMHAINMSIPKGAASMSPAHFVHNKQIFSQNGGLLVEKSSFGYQPTPKYATKSAKYNDQLDAEIGTNDYFLSVDSVVYGQGFFFLSLTLTMNGKDKWVLLRSNDEGATWTRVNITLTGDALGSKINSFKYDRGSFCAVGCLGQYTRNKPTVQPLIVESIDGMTWTQATNLNDSSSNVYRTLYDVACPYPGKWVAVGKSFTSNGLFTDPPTMNLLGLKKEGGKWIQMPSLTVPSIPWAGWDKNESTGVFSIAYNKTICMATGALNDKLILIRIPSNLTTVCTAHTDFIPSTTIGFTAQSGKVIVGDKESDKDFKLMHIGVRDNYPFGFISHLAVDSGGAYSHGNDLGEEHATICRLESSNGILRVYIDRGLHKPLPQPPYVVLESTDWGKTWPEKKRFFLDDNVGMSSMCLTTDLGVTTKNLKNTNPTVYYLGRPITY